MDKKIANNVIVGIFVIVGFVGFLFVLFNINGGKGMFSRDKSIFGKFEHVKGLNYGSEVALAGLRIGTVNKISLAPDGTKELVVEMTISPDMFDRIRKDSVATIKTSGVLGDKYIEISIGTLTEPGIEAGAFIPTEEPADIFSKTGTVVDDISRQFKQGSDFDQLLANLNRAASNLVVITDGLKSKTGLWHEMVAGTSGEKVSKATGHLEGILRKVNAGEGTLGALINDPTVYEDLKALMGGAKRSSILKYFMRQFIESGEVPDAPPKGSKGER